MVQGGLKVYMRLKTAASYIAVLAKFTNMTGVGILTFTTNHLLCCKTPASELFFTMTCKLTQLILTLTSYVMTVLVLQVWDENVASQLVVVVILTLIWTSNLNHCLMNFLNQSCLKHSTIVMKIHCWMKNATCYLMSCRCHYHCHC